MWFSSPSFFDPALHLVIFIWKSVLEILSAVFFQRSSINTLGQTWHLSAVRRAVSSAGGGVQQMPPELLPGEGAYFSG